MKVSASSFNFGGFKNSKGKVLGNKRQSFIGLTRNLKDVFGIV